MEYQFQSFVTTIHIGFGYIFPSTSIERLISVVFVLVGIEFISILYNLI
ncbi:hypothetical protein GOQ27_01280 [Clostridium sp. D2Q-11]|uniref:Potassium channel domain-containing protein n=1 Tax=Anaeromonas frigoriresistens TaxID=2683708 RepID=A0A942UWU2_9FIRM|nr:ion channel [Anaeromonas frigoriresistens]MBS4537072.1 hypothetical protein [Anaeromonas frigoriresistens]